MNGTVSVGFEVVRIVWINILLSGDNAVVIALACRDLKGRLKVLGMVLGAGLAVVLRIGFTAMVTTVLNVPYLKVVGGLVLLWIAVKLLVRGEPEEGSIRSHATLWRAVVTVLVADIVMSLDNILAIAAAARNNMTLIVVGLVISVPVVIGGSSLISALIARMPVFAWAGAALLGWIAGDMVFSDPALRGFAPTELIRALWALVAATTVVAAGWYLWRRHADASARGALRPDDSTSPRHER
jgi:YjbE family integral membrane protein